MPDKSEIRRLCHMLLAGVMTDNATQTMRAAHKLGIDPHAFADAAKDVGLFQNVHSGNVIVEDVGVGYGDVAVGSEIVVRKYDPKSRLVAQVIEAKNANI